MNRTMALIRDEIELEGFKPGTPEYERVLLSRQVGKCQEMQNVRACSACKAYWDCSLIQRLNMQNKFGDPK